MVYTPASLEGFFELFAQSCSYHRYHQPQLDKRSGCSRLRRLLSANGVRGSSLGEEQIGRRAGAVQRPASFLRFF